MPIIQLKDRIVCEFGSGDILVAGAKTTQPDGTILDHLIFVQQEPHEVGEKCGQEGEEVEYSVGMFFEKPESIDVVINELLNHKKVKFGSDDFIRKE